MATFDPSFTPIVRDPNAVLVGIAQIRLALQTSIRAAGTASTGVFTPVTKAYIYDDTTTGYPFVRPISGGALTTAPSWTITPSAYTGTVDGCYVIVALTTSTGVMVCPDGKCTLITLPATAVPCTYTALTSSVSVPAALRSDAIAATKDWSNALMTTATPGIVLTVSASSAAWSVGDTFVVPVVSASAQNSFQTGIISPYSMFKGAANSVGGLKDASFDPKIDSIQTLESGFPVTVSDEIIAKTSATIKFGAYEFASTVATVLRNMLNAAINAGDVQAVAAEVVFRLRNGNLITYWCPSCTLVNAPNLAPQNDYSTITWELRVNDQSEAGQAGAYAAALRNSNLYYELTYNH